MTNGSVSSSLLSHSAQQKKSSEMPESAVDECLFNIFQLPSRRRHARPDAEATCGHRPLTTFYV